MTKNDGRLGILNPIGVIFLNGLASSYEDDYTLLSNEIKQHMTEVDFNYAITKINEALIDHWPCIPCTTVGYGCCLCTFGCSFYLASQQVKEAEVCVQNELSHLNQSEMFRQKQIEWKLKRIWWRKTSWIEIYHQTNPIDPI